MAERPLLITIIGIITILVALVFAVLGIGLLLLPESAIVDIWNQYPDYADTTFEAFKAATTVVGGALLIMGIVEFIIGFALLRGWTVAWYLGIIIYGVNFVASLITIMTLVSVVPLVLSAVILYYLFRPNVKEFFGV